MAIPFEDFEKTIKVYMAVFSTWDDEYEKLQGLIRDLSKRKRDEFKLSWRINAAHKRLQTRLVAMSNFRKQHEQLRSVIIRVLKSSVHELNEDIMRSSADLVLDVADASAIEEVNMAYDKVKEVDTLDLSDDGQLLWESSIRRYDERIERVESRITARLRDQLGTAKNANEMFRIFSRFNALFVRPHIRGAIREYQLVLQFSGFILINFEVIHS
jgi:dynein heavy chain 1